jgi:hypothetical protein
MRIPIPKSYDKIFDWIAAHTLPPPTPTGLTLFGHQIDWTDVGVCTIAVAIPTALWLWDGNWFWFPAMAFCMAIAWVSMPR